MSSSGRNQPCPCGSGKKYKRCCLAADETAGLMSASAGTHAAGRPSPGARWHEADEGLTELMLAYAQHRHGKGWLDTIEAAYPGSELYGPFVQMAFPWALYHFEKAGVTVADEFWKAQQNRLSADQHRMFRAHRAARLSLWEITEVTPGESLNVRDLLLGDERLVYDLSASETLHKWDVVLARVLDVNEISIFAGFYPLVLPPLEAKKLLDELSPIIDTLSDERERREWLRGAIGTTALIRLFGAACDAISDRPPPQFRNMDGDELLQTTEYYSFAPSDRTAVIAGLGRLRGIELHESEGDVAVFVVSKRTDGPLDMVTAGRIEVTLSEIKVETNSKRRADGMRRRLQRALGELIEHRERDCVRPDIDQLPTRQQQPPTPAESTPPELRTFLREQKEKYYHNWLDSKLPALGGLTPAVAVTDPSWRSQVVALVKNIEQSEDKLDETERVDVGALRSSLGI